MRVLCYGDSNTYGYDPRSFFGSRYSADSRWVDILAKKTGWKMINDGMNGREIPCRPISVPDDIDLLIIMLGTNDLLQGSGVSAVAERMEAFLSGFNIQKDRILLISPPPMQRGEWVPDHNLIDASIELAQRYQELSKRLEIRFMDAGEWNIAITFDGVHFAEDGHKAFAKELFKEITE